MTATATRTRKAKQERARFEAPLASKGAPLKLTMKRMREVFNQETGTKEAVASTGRYINFTSDGNGGQWYETDDPKEIEFLRDRESFGTYTEVPIPKPDSAPVLAKVFELMRAKDIDAIVKLAAEEEATFEREDVIEACATALEALK